MKSYPVLIKIYLFMCLVYIAVELGFNTVDLIQGKAVDLSNIVIATILLYVGFVTYIFHKELLELKKQVAELTK